MWNSPNRIFKDLSSIRPILKISLQNTWIGSPTNSYIIVDVKISLVKNYNFLYTICKEFVSEVIQKVFSFFKWNLLMFRISSPLIITARELVM